MSDFIVPLGSLPSIGSIGSVGAGSGTTAGAAVSSNSFANVLQEAMGNMVESNAVSQGTMHSLAVGADDDLHTGAIASVKASTAVNYASGLVSSAVKAYQELMRISL